MIKQCISMAAALMMALLFIVAAQAGTYSSDFDQYLSNNQSKDQISAVITMADRVDLEALKTELYARKADRQEWHETVVRAMQDKATESQANILAKLAELQKQGEITSYQNLWLGNLIIVTATQDALNKLVQRADVDQIAPNYEIESIKDIINKDVPLTTSMVESNLTAIHADEVWAMGYTGEGRLVSHLDTGVAGSHEALANRWRGLDSRYTDNPGWAWYDPITETTFPFDSGYHGTHTMGTICGLGESEGDTVGVAFGAEWISAGVIDRGDDSGEVIANALAAFQWVADPDDDPSTAWDVPDVCSNSWGITSDMGYAPCNETFWEVIDYVEACGVVVVFAAGNEGSDAETIRRPADRATTDLNAFSVGAINSYNSDLRVADFSSRGPSYCTENGSMAIKPEVVAPGVDVISAYSEGGYTSMSGTSMAAPHIAGVVALMRQANPDLTADQIKQILLNTASDLGDNGEDNDYGMGIIDAYAAVRSALAYRDDWGVLAGTVTDQLTGDIIEGAAISVVDGNYTATSGADGMYYLLMPTGTTYDIVVDYSPSHVPAYDQQSVVAGETTYVNYALENKVTTTFTVSFANGDDISYRNFYMKGSWDNDGYYDDSWSGDLIAMADDGISPDETAGDGIFTAQTILARDTDNTYSWSVYTENYGVNSIDDAFLANGSDFNITGLEPYAVTTLAPNPSGSDNNFVFAIAGDNGLSFDLQASVNGASSLWGTSVALTANTAYTFTFHVMHGDESIYGDGGVGGADLSYTPSADGNYDIIFDDEDDSYIIQLSSTEGAPVLPSASSGLDGHIPTTWLAPGTTLSTELAYDDGTVYNSVYFGSSESYLAVMFVPESYPITIDSVMVHVVTEGDAIWPFPDAIHDPVGVSIFLDNGSGYPEDDPIYYSEEVAELGEWIRVDIEQLAVTSGNFWVAMNYVSGEGDGLGFDEQRDYDANQWYKMGGTWYGGGYCAQGDMLIRAKVYSDDVSTWLGYDDAIPAEEISAPIGGNFISAKMVSTSPIPTSIPATAKPTLPNMMAYHPHILSEPPMITETELVAGYNLYRSTTSGPYDQGLKINSDLITSMFYDDWGDDTYGPIVNGTTYYYQVSAVYNVGGLYEEIGPSDEFTGVAANHAPAIPQNLASSVNGNTVTLTWDANTDYDIASYGIYRRDPGADEFSSIGTVEHPTVTFSEEINSDGIYRYKIKAIDAEGMESEGYSIYTDVGIGLISPGAITASTDQEFQIELKWKKMSNTGLITDTENLNVAIVHSDESCSEASEVMDYLIENDIVSDYTCFDAQYDTPTLSDLEAFDIVLVWSNYTFLDGGDLGNVLADFVDLGKPVLAFNFCFFDYAPIGGRFADYSPLGASSDGYVYVSLGEYDESHPLMKDVTTLSDSYVSDAVVQNGGEVVAYWDNGYPAVVLSNDYPILCLNTYIGTSNSDWAGDMLQLVYNSVDYLTNGAGFNPDGYKLYKSDSETGSYDLLASLAGNVREYIDSPVPNVTPYYYKVTAIWGSEESEPSNIAEGVGQNHTPEAPTGLTGSVDGYIANLSWAFTDSMGDFDHYNIYRKIYDQTEWNLVGSSVSESYADEITSSGAIYKYCVTAVDNGNPQLESEYSLSVRLSIGNLPPQYLNATSYEDGIVPLSWSDPATLPCTTLLYDDGTVARACYWSSSDCLFGKQFVGTAPISVGTVYIRVLTEGDEDWPWPDSDHDPVDVQIWNDDGTGQPGSLLADTTVTCELGQWITINFNPMITCYTDNFWVSWNNTSGLDAMCLDETSEYPDYDWNYVDGSWIQGPQYDGDAMIRAAITIDGITEVLTEDNPISGSVALQASDDEEDAQLYDTAEMLGYYIYRSTSPDVPVDDAYRITPAYITDTQYNDEDVANGTTYYYIAVAAYDNGGTIEFSDPSNEVSATPSSPGLLAVEPASIDTITYTNNIVTVPMIFTNAGGMPVTFAIEISTGDETIATSSNLAAHYSVLSTYSEITTTCNKPNNSGGNSNPPIITDNGGPDEYGYSWIDSDDENGPEYNWIDISNFGESVNIGDENNFGPFTMGFNFPFYGNRFSSFRLCSNGWISFTSETTEYENAELPTGAEPYNLITPFWEDLNTEEDGGECYYYVGSDSTIISWVAVPLYGTTEFCTFQIILTSDGTITFQYGDMQNDGTSATIGIQNGDGTVGLCVSSDAEYLHSDMAIRIKNCWLSVDLANGTIPVGGNLEVNALLDPRMLEIGTYYGSLAITASDLSHDLDPIEIPITFDVDTVHTSINDDYATLPTTFALDQNYPNPFNAHTEIKYALPVDSDVQLEIYNVLGQKVVTLVDEKQVAGYHSLIWDGTNESGQVVSSGMYLYKLVTNEDTFVKKMVMLK